MSTSASPDIALDHARIECCEPRLALSASITSGLLLDLLNADGLNADGLNASGLNASGSNDASAFAELEIQSLSPSPNPFDGEQTPGDRSPDLLSQAALVRENAGIDGSGQTVAVIDSGVAWDHVALGGGYGPGYRVVGGWDFAENDSDPYDDAPAGFHGTHVSGLLAGQSSDFAGMAPGADIVALRVFDDGGVGQLEWIESALQWVYQNQNAFDSPITTVNLSVGTVLTEQNRAEAASMLEDELQLLRQADILVFAASGNLFSAEGGSEGVLYPASSSSVVSVASVNSTGGLSDFSQRESGVLATRGESIESAVPEHVFGWDGRVDDFATLDGTSMATPQVAGASMLVRQAMIGQGLDPSADEVLMRLTDSATTAIDPVTGVTYRTIDLDAAIGDFSNAEDLALVDRYDGTNQSERVVLDFRDGVALRVGGTSYRFESDGRESPFVIDVGGGDDRLTILGSPEAERLILRPGDVSSLTTNRLQIELRGFESISFTGGGGPDRATLFDSTGSDELTSFPSRTVLKGIGFEFDVQQVPRVYVHGTAGGTDTAILNDGPGDDTLAVRPQYTSLRSEDSFQLAYGFEHVYAYANAGGLDSATLYDSAGDDTMSISAERSIVAGPGYQVRARGFESTVGIANGGGEDIARLYADQPGSQWNATPDRVQWTGDDRTVRIARGFEIAEAFEQFQRVDLLPTPVPLQFDFLTRDDDDSDRESDALRVVFESLGEL